MTSVSSAMKVISVQAPSQELENYRGNEVTCQPNEEQPYSHRGKSYAGEDRSVLIDFLNEFVHPDGKLAKNSYS